MQTLGFLALWIHVQGEGTAPGAVGSTTDIIDLLARSTVVTRVVLLFLVLFSIASWAIILSKLWSFRRAEKHSSVFLDVFRKSSKFSEVQAACRTLANSPLVGIFQTGYAELNGQLRPPSAAAHAGQPAHAGQSPGNPTAVAARPTLKSLAAVDRALLRASAMELVKLERRLPFLATTASLTPFIGLFGTVWGIMGAFSNIGQVGSTNLAVVAPGIAEALIATAAGLFAAIPAVYFYNAFTNRVKLFATEMDDFSLEFINIAEKNFT